MKKLLSIFLSVTLLAATFFAGNTLNMFTFADETVNLIKNGSLESGTEGWTINDGNNRVKWYNDGKGANGTNAYVGINKGWGGPGVFAWKVDPYVNDGCWYRLSFWVKNPSGKRMAIKVYDGGDEANKRLFEELPQSDDWVKVSYLLQTEQYKAMAWLGFTYIDDKGTGGMDTSQILYVDEFTLTKVADSERMLANGDFESLPEMSMWHSASTATLKNDNGNRYAEIADTQRLIQDLSGYEAADNSYKLTMRLSGNNPINIKFTNGGSKTCWEGTVTPKGSTWSEYELTFKNQYETLMQLTVTGTDKNAVTLIDDIKVTKAGGSVPSGEILKNGGFEEGSAHWTLNSNSKIVSDRSYNGNKSLSLALGEYSRDTQRISVEKNTQYKLSFYYNAATAETFEVCVYAGSSWDGNKLLIPVSADDKRHAVNPKGTNTWEEYTTYFNSGDNTALTVGFQAAWFNYARSGALYIDDVEIKKIVDDGGFRNGGFEDDGLGWTITAGEIITDKMLANSGNKCLSTGIGAHQRSSQKFKVEKNTDYIVSFYYKTELAKKFEVNIYADTSDGKNPWDSGKLLPSTDVDRPEWGYCIMPERMGAWVMETLSFNSGNHDELYIGFQANLDSNPRTQKFYIDDVSVEKRSNSNPIIKNGDFEQNLTGWNIKLSDSSSAGKFFVTADAESGNKYLTADVDTYTRMYQSLNLDENHSRYKVSFYYKQPKDDGLSVVSLGRYNDAFATEGVYYKTALARSEDWTKLEFVFDSGTTAEKPVYSLFLNFQTSMTSAYCIDNITVEKTTDSVTPFSVGEIPGPIIPASGGELYNNTAGPFITSEDKNLITDFSFEGGASSTGNWNTSAFIKENLTVVKDSEVAHSGEYGLKFSTGKDSKRSTFIVAVEPNTDYYFTTWVKYPGWSKQNTGNMTFGVSNADSGEFIYWDGWTTTGTYYSDTRQFNPLAPDNEWHLTCVKFCSNSAKTVGITLSGPTSTIYFDDMYLMKAEDAERYVEHNSLNRRDWKNAVAVGNRTTDLIECGKGVTNLIDNADADDSVDKFWSKSSAYGRNVNIKDLGSLDRENALVYNNNDLYPDRTYYIKWIDVEKNTNYTFSTEYLLEKGGDDTFFAVLGGERQHLRTPNTVYTVSLSKDDCSENPVWESIGITFNSGDCDSIGFAVFNDGGTAYFDRLRLFETKNADGAENGIKRQVTTVSYKLESNKYTVQNGRIVISPTKNGTKLSDIVKTFKHSGYIKVYDADNNIISDLSKIAGTGMRIKLMNGPEVIESATVIMYGDVDGDGLLTASDIRAIRNHVIGKTLLSDIFFDAADMDKDKSITIHDAVAIAQNRLDR